jgi:hypothetical protein
MGDEKPAQDQPKPKQSGYPNLNRGGFPRGVSPNPGGRPKGVSIVRAIRRQLKRTMAELKAESLDNLTARDFLAIQAIVHAGKGKSAYFRELMAHIDGRPVIRIEQTKAGEETREAEISPEDAAAGLRAIIESAERRQRETQI